jgi:hypothetical protein
MNIGPELLLIGAVAAVGVLHTMVPDHWMPIALFARQRGWSKAETARAALQAGIGHVLSTLLIALVVWLAGMAVANRFGQFVDTAASIALVGFGGWVAVSAWRELRGQDGHPVTASIEEGAPLQEHRHKPSERTALLLILGSSPMVEGIPAFFAAGKYGIGLIIVMSIVFAISTIATYVLLCVFSTAGLQRVRLGALERYGEVMSGAFIALVGIVFWVWPTL